MNVRNNFATPSSHPEQPNSDLHILGALVAGNLPPDAVSANQWPAITGLALQHGLAPMLHWTLKQAGADFESNPVWQPLAHARYKTAIDWALKERAQLEIDTALRAAGIPAIWLKGSVLARTVYPEPSLRPMGDLDILVPYGQRVVALEVMRKIGFDFYIKEGVSGFYSTALSSLHPTSHDFHLRGGIGNKVVVELHFRLLGHDDMLTLEQLHWFFEQQQYKTTEKPLNTLSPEAHLLYLSAHAVLQHGEAQQYLLRYYDLHCLITHYPLAWDIVIDKAIMLKWTFLLERALVNTRDFFTTPLPSLLLTSLASRRSSGEDMSRVIERQKPIFHWKQVSRSLSYMSLGNRLQFLFRIVFPTPAFIRQYYRLEPGVRVWPYYFVRLYKRGCFWVRAIWAHVRE